MNISSLNSLLTPLPLSSLHCPSLFCPPPPEKPRASHLSTPSTSHSTLTIHANSSRNVRVMYSTSPSTGLLDENVTMNPPHQNRALPKSVNSSSTSTTPPSVYNEIEDG